VVERLQPKDLRARIERGERLVLLDVREAEELAICRLPDVVHIPLGDLALRARELDPAAAVVCICHHGMRSANAAAFLERLGFEHVSNLQGGVERWATEVDPGLPRY
jgi:rhodanese-related sulfurtransferase